jgi:hypothetical protein
MHLRELWRLRLGLAISTLLASLAAVASVANISVFPPGLSSRSVEMSTAFTQVVVDTPNSAILDLRQGTDDIQSLKNRAVLVGTVAASPPVRAFIARRAGISPDILQIVTPRTPEEPRPRAETGQKKGPSDLLRSTDQYRLDIQTNPTVPLVDIYAQAPTARASEELANAAVDGLGDFLRELAATESTPNDVQIELRQLGRARGDVLNEGVGVQVAVLSFLAVFATCCVVAMGLARVRRGWAAAADARQRSAAHGDPGEAWTS